MAKMAGELTVYLRTVNFWLPTGFVARLCNLCKLM